MIAHKRHSLPSAETPPLLWRAATGEVEEIDLTEEAGAEWKAGRALLDDVTFVVVQLEARGA